MDTTMKPAAEATKNYSSKFPWLTSVTESLLPQECFPHVVLRHANLQMYTTVLHRTDQCVYRDNNRAQLYYEHVDEARPAYLCSCMFAAGAENPGDFEFSRILYVLRRYYESLDTSLLPDRYGSDADFPAFKALAVRYHRDMVGKMGFAGVPLQSSITEHRLDPRLEGIRRKLCERWDRAEEDHPLNPAQVAENSMRYAARYFVWKRLNQVESRNVPYAMHNHLNALVGKWLARPVTTSLLDEFFAPHAAALREDSRKVTTPSFSTDTLRSLDSEWAVQMLQTTMVACHIGSPTMEAFNACKGPRPLLLWYGIRARGQQVAWGEYPGLVLKWLQASGEDLDPQGFECTKPGGLVSPICENPGLDSVQWSLALKLWEESFASAANGVTNQEPTTQSPFRDQKVAIDAARHM